MARHELKAGAETCHWGWFGADTPAVLAVESGDTVVIETVSGGEDVLPPPGFHVPAAQREIIAKAERMLPGHMLTGPVAVAGAEPGDVLEVRIGRIDVTTDWGWNFIKPLAGALPEDFPDYRLVNIPLDREKNVAKLPWGVDLPLNPFFGVMGVAPPPAWGRVTSLIPRAFGGNLDNKELREGATLYLPVFVPGANFSAGDGHGAQGDGEVNVTAIETALTGEFTLILRKDMKLDYPRAETETHLVTMAMHPDLDICAERALRSMIALLGEVAGLGREDAYMLCSLAADLRITQVVNGSKGVHCMIAKDLARRG